MSLLIPTKKDQSVENIYILLVGILKNHFFYIFKHFFEIKKCYFIFTKRKKKILSQALTKRFKNILSFVFQIIWI